MEHASHFSTKEVAEGESEVQGHPQFHSAVDTASNNHLSLELLFTNFTKKGSVFNDSCVFTYNLRIFKRTLDHLTPLRYCRYKIHM